ncbi:hypothetical protein [Planctomicrobium sp. SH527]|uniref:hypothetical protein n=1 Tax=Planctomicrobium sp. SH527 TaxID=3448123 RepID=UPI003F5C5BB3
MNERRRSQELVSPISSVALIGALCLYLVAVPLLACPFCDAPSTTFSEQLSQAQSVALVTWNGANKPDPLTFTNGSTTFKALEIYKQKAAELAKNQNVTMTHYQPGERGDLFWMLGTETEGKHNWAPPVPMSRECWEYIIKAPSRDLEISKRLKYYLNFLEHSDPEIAIDAYGEFAGSPYSALVSIKELLPRAKIVGWLQNPETTPTRRGLYGLMLGLCGTDAEKRYLEEQVLQQTEDIRFGIDGMMAGYVLLAGDAGMKKLADTKLRDPSTITSEVFSTMQLMRFLWEYTDGEVSKDLLKSSMRLLLNHPQYASLALVDLARWKDWEITPRIVKQYNTGIYADSYVKQSVIRFLISASEDKAMPETAELKQAKAFLAKLREEDPETVKNVERNAFD